MVVGVAVGILCGALALARGGSVSNVAATRFRYLPVLFAGFATQFGFELWDPDWLSPADQLRIVLVTSTTVAVFLFLNRELPGMLLASAGLMLNVLVIASNGAMPVSPEAARIAGIEERLDSGIQHEPLDPGSRLGWLADVIHVPRMHLVVSVGDLVLAAGLGRLVYKRAMSGDEDEKVSS